MNFLGFVLGEKVSNALQEMKKDEHDPETAQLKETIVATTAETLINHAREALAGGVLFFYGMIINLGAFVSNDKPIVDPAVMEEKAMPYREAAVGMLKELFDGRDISGKSAEKWVLIFKII